MNPLRYTLVADGPSDRCVLRFIRIDVEVLYG